MTEYNEWFDEVSVEEYNRFVRGLKLIKPNHVTSTSPKMDGVEWRLDTKLVAFSIYNDDGSTTCCVANEDIVC
jgi:hypothetical protein